TAGRQRRAAVEKTDIVETEKSPLKDVVPFDVLAVHPPGEIKHQLVKDAFEKGSVTLPPMMLPIDLVDTPRRPSMNRWVDIAKRPFISRQLAIGVHVPIPRQQEHLALGIAWIDKRQGYGVKGEVPSGVPGVFPFVRHRDDVGVVQMRPVRIASMQS